MQQRQQLRRQVQHIVTVFAVALIVATACGTDRFYSDRLASSPNGHFEFTAVSPDNAAEKPTPFADDFVYTFRDVQADTVLWTRRQAESSPVALYVNDAAWSIVHTSADEILVHRPNSATVALRFLILHKFDVEDDRHVIHTTAGPMWAFHSRWSFFQYEGNHLFVIRTWWDRRIVVDLDNARLLEEPTPDLILAMDADDRRIALANLDGAADRYLACFEAHRQRWDEQREIELAVHLAGRLQIKDAIASLRELEGVSTLQFEIDEYDTVEILGAKSLNPFAAEPLEFRQRVHVALRRIGEKPTELPCTVFRVTQEDGSWTYIRAEQPPGFRAERTELVQPGMTPKDVLRAIGPPDYIKKFEFAWEYDMDADEPFTFRVQFKGLRAVTDVQTIRPPKWQHGDLRYEWH